MSNRSRRRIQIRQSVAPEYQGRARIQPDGSKTQCRCSNKKAGPRRPMQPRVLHVLDIENMCGCGLPSEESIERAIGSFRSCLGVRDDDQAMLVASGRTLFTAGHAWSGTQRGVGKGKDGADLEILRRCDVTHIATRFTRVVLASGDPIFAPLVLALQDAGVQVTIVARTGSISSALRRTRAQVRHLPDDADGSNGPHIAGTDTPEGISGAGGGLDRWDVETPVLAGAGSGR